MPKKIFSGGQTGVDRGALNACLANSYPCGGWCPKNRHAEDGPIDQKYPLQETNETNYEVRTRLNVKSSDGTLIISPGHLFGGTFFTKQIADEIKKPILVISSFNKNFQVIADEIIHWTNSYSVNTLNVAGPRKSEWLTGYDISFLITKCLIQQLRN